MSVTETVGFLTILLLALFGLVSLAVIVINGVRRLRIRFELGAQHELVVSDEKISIRRTL